MRKPLGDFSADEVCRACEQNYIDYWRSVGLSPNAEFSESSGVTRCITGLHQEFLNVVLRSRIAVDSVDPVIDEMIDEFRRRKLFLTWHVGKLTEPGNLGDYLADLGFPHDYDLTAMAFDLDGDFDSSTPSGVTVRTVANGDDSRNWISCLTRAWESPANVSPWMNDNACFSIPLESKMHAPLPRRLYLGLLDREPAAASMLYWSDDIAGLQCVGTVHSARGRGIGGAVVRSALTDARSLGFRCVVVLSTVEGVGMYRRLGFKTFGKLPEHSMDFR